MNVMHGMTSLDRALTALDHREPDRVPMFLTLTMHGAREMGMTIRDYYMDTAAVVEGQVRMRAKYDNDCLIGFTYAAVEVEAFGGETVFVDDGPPNAGAPVIRRPGDIDSLRPPAIDGNPPLERTLKLISLLKERAAGEAPVLGVAIAPHSLPVMQMGFDKYLDLIYEQPERFERLMAINEEFCVNWANAQLKAGVTAVTYYDPVSSPTITTRDMAREKGFPIAARVISRLDGPAGFHFASGRSLAVVDDVAGTGAVIVSASAVEDLAEVKAACGGRLTVIGNLNGLEMVNWDSEQAEDVVSDVIRKGAPGGGFILSDNHGEIPWQVPEDTLMVVSESVKRFGTYPIAKAGDAR